MNQTIATKLIKIYDYVCQKYENELQYHVERFSNNTNQPEFTDQEIMTIYLFCVHQEKRFKIRDIYNFTNNYLLDWFPKLPSYTAYCTRLNRLTEAFKYLTIDLLQDFQPIDISLNNSLIDSLPVITCSAKRQAKVAPQLTDKTFSATKGIWYHGLKIHILGFETANQMPHPEYIILSKASQHDLSVFKENLVNIENRNIFADKAYCDKELSKTTYSEKNTQIITPIKATKGKADVLNKFDKAAENLYSRAVSAVRQPIESLFNWLIEKTDIQRASKVRSEKGLLIHVFGKLAAAFIKAIF